jgi:hypothetical protein
LLFFRLLVGVGVKLRLRRLGTSLWACAARKQKGKLALALASCSVSFRLPFSAAGGGRLSSLNASYQSLSAAFICAFSE